MGAGHPYAQLSPHTVPVGGGGGISGEVALFQGVVGQVVQLVVAADRLDVLPVFATPAAERGGTLAPVGGVVFEGDAAIRVRRRAALGGNEGAQVDAVHVRRRLDAAPAEDGGDDVHMADDAPCLVGLA